MHPSSHPTPHSKVAAAQAVKDKGNAAYKGAKLERAARLYGRAVDVLGDGDYGLDKETPEVRGQVRKFCWWTESLGHMGDGDYGLDKETPEVRGQVRGG